ncbi:MAG: hypothetical protein KAH54_12355 [Candidatus Sabulitectum sp.]|nr:hypothetical protein [Candidatus Sabulitectum sp.]
MAKCAGILSEKASEMIKVVNLKELPEFDVTSFHKIILGASVYMGRIQKEITDFCGEHQQQLLTKKLGLFICSGNHSETGREYLKLFSDELYNHAVSKKLFGDEVYWEKLNLLEKITMMIIKKTRTSTSDLETEAIAETVKEMRLL